VHAQRSWEPPRLYSWSIVGAAGTGACGVTGNYETALDEVVDVLASAPVGSRGLVHRVSMSFIRTAYRYEGLIARCRMDRGDLVWDDIPPPSTWTHVRPLFTDPDSDALGDAIPPEAIVTGFVDIQAHKERLQQAIGQSRR
jgi:hypothetical protein